MDPNFIQKRMQEIQSSEDFVDAFSKIVSGGRAGYRAVIEKKQIIIQCHNCKNVLEVSDKFCRECGTKVEK